MAPDVPMPDRITPEQFAELPERGRYELVEGRLRDCGEREPQSTRIANVLSYLVLNPSPAVPSGWFSNRQAEFCCFPAATIRRLDFSVVAFHRAPPRQGEGVPTSFTVCPDFGALIVAEHDTYFDVEHSIVDFLDAGTPLLWAIFPKMRSARTYEGPRAVHSVRGKESLTGGRIYPSLRIAADQLFALAESPEFAR
jgi:hypothetical protein